MKKKKQSNFLKLQYKNCDNLACDDFVYTTPIIYIDDIQICGSWDNQDDLWNGSRTPYSRCKDCPSLIIADKKRK